MGFSRQEYWSGVPLPSPKNVYLVEFFADELGRHGKHYDSAWHGVCAQQMLVLYLWPLLLTACHRPGTEVVPLEDHEDASLYPTGAEPLTD